MGTAMWHFSSPRLVDQSWVSNTRIEASNISGIHAQGGAKTAKLLTALQGLSPEASNITVPGAGAAVEIWAVLDPLSKTAQRVAPVLQFLADTLQPSIKASSCLAPASNLR